MLQAVLPGPLVMYSSWSSADVGSQLLFPTQGVRGSLRRIQALKAVLAGGLEQVAETSLAP